MGDDDDCDEDDDDDDDDGGEDDEEEHEEVVDDMAMALAWHGQWIAIALPWCSHDIVTHCHVLPCIYHRSGIAMALPCFARAMVWCCHGIGIWRGLIWPIHELPCLQRNSAMDLSWAANAFTRLRIGIAMSLAWIAMLGYGPAKVAP